MEFLWEGLLSITWQQAVMYLVGILLIYLAIKKDYEPPLLLPMGFGAILVNLPLSGVINQEMEGIGVVNGIIEWLFNVGIDASEALPILLFIGIGAMIDFGPLLSMPLSLIHIFSMSFPWRSWNFMFPNGWKCFLWSIKSSRILSGASGRFQSGSARSGNLGQKISRQKVRILSGSNWTRSIWTAAAAR